MISSSLSSSLSSRKGRIFVFVVICSIVAFKISGVFRPSSFYRSLPSISRPSITQEVAPSSPPTSVVQPSSTTTSISQPALPSIYTSPDKDSDECQSRYGLKYIEDAAKTNRNYCEQEDASQMQCFHSNAADGRFDPFCIASNVALPLSSTKFEIDCHSRHSYNPLPADLAGTIPVSEFKEDWYNTGPGYTFPNHFDIGKDYTTDLEHCRSPPNKSEEITHTILVKREGQDNIWHSLMEIMAYTMTMDILSLATAPDGGPFFSSDRDIQNTQVVLLDDGGEGPLYELWNMIAKRPIRRIKDLESTELSCLPNIIIPLSGATNPLWLGDWTPHSCRNSKILSVFVERVLTQMAIDTSIASPQILQASKRRSSQPLRRQNNLVLTFIKRTGTRRLINQDSLFEAFRQRFPHITLNIIDFAGIPLRTQIHTARTSDILVGVHGAGLTHAMFMREDTAVVEILPWDVRHKGFRNLANLRGLRYFSTHITSERDKDKDWHFEDVDIDETRFLQVISAAVGSMYHQGLMDLDVA
ncbi:hypothetical protein BGZ60DRAFT_397020 [Tricladium varicosporioides]|nr:hypothetical protein BGZ60DRAFT_397020 [Hymenoscyphus varicosporioides]